MCTERRPDHPLTTSSSQAVLCIVFHAPTCFITTTTSAGNCAHYTISGAGSLYFTIRHSFPAPKARGSNPPGRTKSSIFLDAALFILYEIERDVARGGFEQLHRRPPPAPPVWFYQRYGRRYPVWCRLRVMPYFPLEQNSLFVQPFFALAGRELFRWVYCFLCGFQPVFFVIVAAGYHDERTVLPSFSDACHFDHSAVY